MPRVHVAFGGNLGQVRENLRAALEALHGLPRTRILRISSLYRTAPVGPADQPDFLNGAVELETDMEPGGLLDALLRIEARLGRVRKVRWGPRTVDLDLLLWEDRVLRSEGLEIPHPRLHERAFVLAPLAEIAPLALHPVLHRSVVELMDALGRCEGVERLSDPTWAAWARTLEKS